MPKFKNQIITTIGSFLYAFDLSMSCTGLVIFDSNNNPVHITSIPTKDKDSHGVRLKQIADKILELREKYPPCECAIERGFSQFNTATAVIYRVHGLINYLFHDVEQTYYPPKKVKLAILHGDATKKQLQKVIKLRYPEIKFTIKEIKDKKTKQIRYEESDDESDAFAVGLTHLILTGKLAWNK